MKSPRGSDNLVPGDLRRDRQHSSMARLEASPGPSDPIRIPAGTQSWFGDVLQPQVPQHPHSMQG